MNKKYFKAAVLQMYIFSFCASICVANSTIIPIIICLILVPFIKKMIKSMSEYQVQEALGVAWLQKKFNNNPVIMDMTKE